jgi:hypothetical protein
MSGVERSVPFKRESWAMVLAFAAMSQGCSAPPDPADVKRLVSAGLTAQYPSLSSVDSDITAVRERLCGVPPGGMQWKLLTQEMKIVGEVTEQRTVLQAKGRCISFDGLLERRYEGTLVAGFAYSDATTKTGWRRFSTTRIWSLSSLRVESSTPPSPVQSAPEGRTSVAKTQNGCPDSAEAALLKLPNSKTYLNTCDPGSRQICWYGEIGCRCGPGQMGAGRYRCAERGSAGPRPTPGERCDQELVRWLDARPDGGSVADASPVNTAVECRAGAWREVSLE